MIKLLKNRRLYSKILILLQKDFADLIQKVYGRKYRTLFVFRKVDPLDNMGNFELLTGLGLRFGKEK